MYIDHALPLQGFHWLNQVEIVGGIHAEPWREEGPAPRWRLADSPCHLEAGDALHRGGQTAHRVRHPTFGRVLRRREGHEKRCREAPHDGKREGVATKTTTFGDLSFPTQHQGTDRCSWFVVRVETNVVVVRATRPPTHHAGVARNRRLNVVSTVSRCEAFGAETWLRACENKKVQFRMSCCSVEMQFTKNLRRAWNMCFRSWLLPHWTQATKKGKHHARVSDALEPCRTCQ